MRRISSPRSLLLSSVLVCGSLVAFASAGDITVSPTSTSLQATIDSLPPDNSNWVRILLEPGTYTQQLNVDRPHVMLVGLGAKPDEVVLTYHLSAISPKRDGSGNVGTTGSASTFVKSPDFAAANVTFANSTPDNTAQAVAIKTQSDRCVFDHCRFIGFQDTLYPTAGRCYFHDCYITGDTDFIFGNATAIFEHCTINSSDAGYVTAANTDPNTPHGFVFLDCTLTADERVRAGSVYLGRPWQWDRNKNASVTFVRTTVGPHVAAGAWSPWARQNADPASHARYAEFASKDLEGRPADTSGRVPWSRQLTESEAATYRVAEILAGQDHWDPESVVGLANQGSR